MELIFTLLTNLLFTAFVYLLIPVIMILTKKKYSKKQLKAIVVINGLCVFFLFAFVHFLLNDSETPNFTATIFWSYMSYMLLNKTCLKNVDELNVVSTECETEKIRVQISNPNEKPREYGNFNTYAKDILLAPTETKSVTSMRPEPKLEKKEFNACDIAKELSEKCAKTVIQINRNCNEIGIDYNERKLAIATFAYFFAKWAYTNKSITFAQVGEVQKLYIEQFSEFNKVAFQDDSFKSVMENEQIFTETLDKFLNYAKAFYNSENNSFSKELLEKYILEFIKNESDIVTLKEFL